MVNFLTYQEYTTITNISTAAMTVLPLPNPGARLSLEISEPLGLHLPSRKTTKDNCNNKNYNRRSSVSLEPVCVHYRMC